MVRESAAMERKRLSIDWQRWRSQFAQLDRNDPSRWPILPRGLLLLGVVALIVSVLWFAWLSGQREALDAERRREEELRAQFSQKLAIAAHRDVLKLQLEEVRQYVTLLEKQLPSRAEMDALLSDINQAGIGRGLQFELFRPGQETVREYYAELPITIRVTGRYHDVGQFVADVAHLSRIVTLHDLAVSPHAKLADQLTVEAIARTYRYLDPDELKARNAAEKKKGGGK